MPSVSFCNLGDAYGDWGSEKKSDEPKNLNETNTENSTEIVARNSNHNCPTCGHHDGLGNLPNLPTFQNAEGCMVRNNRFQNTIAQNTFQLQNNPLNPMGETGSSAIQQQYLSQTMMAPHMNRGVNFNSLPPTVGSYGANNNPYGVPPNLPIPNQMNIWPPQRWVVNPNGPVGYESYDPFAYGSHNMPYHNPGQMDRGYQMTNGQIRENFEGFAGSNFRGSNMTDTILEYFGNGNPDKGSQLLSLVLFILFVLFFIQLIELIVSARVDNE